MKIGIVLTSTPAYSETFFKSKIIGLQKNGFEVVLFVNSKENFFDLCTVKKQVKSRMFCNSIFFLLTNLSTILKFIFLERNDKESFKNIFKKLILNQHILQESHLKWLHFGFATHAVGRENIAKAIGAKMAVSFRGYDIDVFPLKYPNCFNLLSKKVDKIHAISYYLLNKAISLGFDKKTPYRVITPALESFQSNSPISKINNSKYFKILTIGRLHWVKNYSDILKSLKILKENDFRFKYHIIGEGDLIEALKFQAYEFGLSLNIVFEGKLSHKKTLEILNESDIYIQYSYSEGFCNSVLEAQSKGVLSIVSDAGALSENILNNKTGWVIPKNNPTLLAEKIAEVISLSESKKDQIRKHAVKRVVKEYSIEKQQKEFIDFYRY
ncbi:glycosyltransferase family 4 protein [Bacteroidia bacterium]|nr:glycosyltransferase family 4 protein [Bacteroidia bacterium]